MAWKVYLIRLFQIVKTKPKIIKQDDLRRGTYLLV